MDSLISVGKAKPAPHSASLKIKKARRHYGRAHVTPAFVQTYMDAFAKHYPTHTIEVRPRRQLDDTTRYSVIINGQAGDISLSESDIRDATRAFNL